MIQIAINLVGNVANTIHANPGMHAPYNLLTCPPDFGKRQCLLCLHHNRTLPQNRNTEYTKWI